MAFLDSYRQQVALLIRVIPFVAKEDVFALKGGTAINLFVRDMPRLSVDIDLTYLPVGDRAASLAAIDGAMLRIKDRIEEGMPGAKVTASRSVDEKIVTKLIVRHQGAQIKIEVTPVLRGTVYDPVLTGVVPTVEDTFGFAEIQVVSFADLYAGKIVAALDLNTLATSSTCVTCSQTRASTMCCAVPFSSICPATTAPWRRCSPRPASRCMRSSSAALPE